MTTRREALLMLSAAPIVAKLDLLSKDDLAVLEIANHLEGSDKPGRSYNGESEISEVIRSLAHRGYLVQHAFRDDAERFPTRWYKLTEKGHGALDAAA
jgi:hypothetical protein